MKKVNLSLETLPTLGQLLFEARAKLNVGRAEIAKRAGITEGSLVRYERAGIDEQGQYPPAPKLASLCAVLRINSALALQSCLPEEMSEWSQELNPKFQLFKIPEYQFVRKQYEKLLHDTDILRSALLYTIDAKLDEGDSDGVSDEFLREVQTKALEVHYRHSAFEDRMVELGIYTPTNRESIVPDQSIKDLWKYEVGVSPEMDKFRTEMMRAIDKLEVLDAKIKEVEDLKAIIKNEKRLTGKTDQASLRPVQGGSAQPSTTHSAPDQSNED